MYAMCTLNMIDFTIVFVSFIRLTSLQIMGFSPFCWIASSSFCIELWRWIILDDPNNQSRLWDAIQIKCSIFCCYHNGKDFEWRKWNEKVAAHYKIDLGHFRFHLMPLNRTVSFEREIWTARRKRTWHKFSHHSSQNGNCKCKLYTAF